MLKLSLVISLFALRLWACASPLELSSVVVDPATESLRLRELRALVLTLKDWDDFLDAGMDRTTENRFLASLGLQRKKDFFRGLRDLSLMTSDEEEIFKLLREERILQFNKWLWEQRNSGRYVGDHGFADFVGNFNVVDLYDSEKRKKRIAALEAAAVIQECNVIMESELAQHISPGQPFRVLEDADFPTLKQALARVGHTIDPESSVPVHTLIVAESRVDKPLRPVLRRYRLHLSVFRLGQLCGIDRRLGKILAVPSAGF